MQQTQPQFAVEGGHLVMSHHESTGLPQVKDATVNDRDRMQDLLAQEKYMTSGYDTSRNEASHHELYMVLAENHHACHRAQRDIYDMMFKKGWYKVPVADAPAVTHAYDQFQQYLGQFPFPSHHHEGAH